MDHRIHCFNIVWASVKTRFCDRRIPLTLRVSRWYSTLARTALFMAGGWAPRETVLNKIRNVETQCFREMIGRKQGGRLAARASSGGWTGSSMQCALGSAPCLSLFRLAVCISGGLATLLVCRRTGPLRKWSDGVRWTTSIIARSWGSTWTAHRAGGWHDLGGPPGGSMFWRDWWVPSGCWMASLGRGGPPRR